MHRRVYLEAALDAVVNRVPAPTPASDDAWQLAIASFAASEMLEHQQAAAWSQQALAALTPDAAPVVTVACAGASALSSASSLVSGEWTDMAHGRTPTGDPVRDALPLAAALGDDDDAQFARYLLAEGALACARVKLASELPMPVAHGFLARDGRAHPFSAVLTVLAAQIATFSGRVAEAKALLSPASSEVPLFQLFIDATQSLVAGNSADPKLARALVARVEAQHLSPDGRIAAGCSMLAAYGLIALGDIGNAARLVLVAGDGPELAHLMVFDRAIGFEILVNAALHDGDLDAAEAWAARVSGLAESPIANSTVARIESRICLAAGDTVGATEAAVRALMIARREGRGIEAAEAEILAARAELAGRGGAAAGRRLQALATGSTLDGHLAAVRAASHELRASGLRLRPLVGSGWAGLSDRECEVGRLLVAGHSNAEIAATLYLSQHTVHAHVSRVLAAFGVASRLALAAHERLEAGGGVPPGLTARQRAVVSELATGASNAEIAARLGISVKTVEKHLLETRIRLGAASRVGILQSVSGVEGHTDE